MRGSRQDRLLLLLLFLEPALRRGLSLGPAVRAMKGDGPLDDRTLDGMADELDEGRLLSEVAGARREVFATPLPAMLRAGELLGDLPGALSRARHLVRQSVRTRREVRAALVYPAICLCLILALALLVAWFDLVGLSRDLTRTLAVPTHAGWIDPVVTRVALAGGVAAGLAALVWLSSSRRGLIGDRLLLDLPVIGRLHRLRAAAGYTRALGALLAGGLPIDAAIDGAAAACGNRWVERELGLRLASVRDGEALARALTIPGVFPPSLTWRLALGVERQELPRALDEAAEAYEADLAVYSGRLARTVEPAAIVVVGIVACWITWTWLEPLRLILHANDTF